MCTCVRSHLIDVRISFLRNDVCCHFPRFLLSPFVTSLPTRLWGCVSLPGRSNSEHRPRDRTTDGLRLSPPPATVHSLRDVLGSADLELVAGRRAYFCTSCSSSESNAAYCRDLTDKVDHNSFFRSFQHIRARIQSYNRCSGRRCPKQKTAGFRDRADPWKVGPIYLPLGNSERCQCRQ